MNGPRGEKTSLRERQQLQAQILSKCVSTLNQMMAANDGHGILEPIRIQAWASLKLGLSYPKTREYLDVLVDAGQLEQTSTGCLKLPGSSDPEPPKAAGWGR